MMKAARLDWTVEKRPARGASVVWARKPALLKPGAKISEEDEVEYSRYELVRPTSGEDPTETVFGIVGARYEPLQNRDAFAFFDPIVDQKTAFFETAGALGDGERVWVMARMRGDMEIVPGDHCRRYLLLSNTHDGKGSVMVKFTAVRVVCQNTLNLALKTGEPGYRVRHSKLVKDRLDELAKLIATASDVYSRAAAVFKLMAAGKLTDVELNEYLDTVFPKTARQRERKEMPERWTVIRDLFNSRRNDQPPAVEGTLWSAYNAITYFEDHKQDDQETQSTRLERVWFGGGAEIKTWALVKAYELVEVN